MLRNDGIIVRLLLFLLCTGDDELDEEKDLIIQQIQKLAWSSAPNLPVIGNSNGTMSFWRASEPVNHTTRRSKIMYIALHAYSHQGLLYFWRVLLLVSGAVADDCPFWRICSWFRETRINGCIYREKRAAEIELTREWVFFEKKERRGVTNVNL